MYSKADSCEDTPNQTIVSHSLHASCLSTGITCPLLSFFSKIYFALLKHTMKIIKRMILVTASYYQKAGFHTLKIHTRLKYSNRAVTSLIIIIMIISHLPALISKHRMGTHLQWPNVMPSIYKFEQTWDLMSEIVIN